MKDCRVYLWRVPINKFLIITSSLAGRHRNRDLLGWAQGERSDEGTLSASSLSCLSAGEMINPETEIRQTNMIRVFTELLQTKTLEKLRRSQRVIR